MFFLSLLYDLCQTLWKFLHKKRASPDKCEALFGWEAIFEIENQAVKKAGEDREI